MLDDKPVEAGGNEDVAFAITNTTNHSCRYNWTIAKTGGTPTVAIGNNANGSIEVAAHSTHTALVNVAVNAVTSAVDSAVLTLTVTGVGDGCCGATDTGKICVIPTGEMSSFIGWAGGAGVDLSQWRGTLQPTTANFRDRTVHENPAGSGTNTTDTCWFFGSALPMYTDANSISGGSWLVGAGNQWQTDTIGITANIDAYYAAAHRTPCTWSTVQHMKIVCDCCNTDVEYTTNDFDWDIRAAGTQISRGGTASTRH